MSTTRDYADDKGLPSLADIEATVRQINDSQMAHVLIYVTTYLTIRVDRKPIDEEALRDAYAAAFKMQGIETIKTGI
jgi:hypothetical protein